MENLPLVSVITITRNRGKLIGRCIDSVLNQTYKNIEHIIVDGASDDETDNVVSKYTDTRLRYFKLESNWELVKTINFGVEKSRGEYITFLDSDDEYLSTKVEKQVSLLNGLPEDYGMVYCWMTSIDSVTKDILYFHKPQLRGFVGDEVVERQVVSGTPTFMFRRNAFMANGGWKTKEEIGIISDWELAARFCQKWKVDYVAESLINVYENHGSLRMSSKKYYKDWYVSTIKFRSYFLCYFGDVFKRFPRKAAAHYRVLLECNIMIGEYKKAFMSYKNLLRTSNSFKYLIAPVYYLFKKYCYGVK